ncbi:hypothetical protein EIP86_005981 [Pleurotus ostreatoroseus]|nr:hypothetical protein EIP86_005981 [Pleurotus ostreatoroseus]
MATRQRVIEHSLVTTISDFAAELHNALEQGPALHDDGDPSISQDSLPALDHFSPLPSPCTSPPCNPTSTSPPMWPYRKPVCPSPPKKKPRNSSSTTNENLRSSSSKADSFDPPSLKVSSAAKRKKEKAKALKKRKVAERKTQARAEGA